MGIFFGNFNLFIFFENFELNKKKKFDNIYIDRQSFDFLFT